MCTTNTNSLNVQQLNEVKDIKLTAQEQRMYSFLLNGGEWSNKELLAFTTDRDPRSTIRYLRSKGIAVSDKWVTEEGSRFKLYFVH
jgi:hypothetical protein